MRSLHSIGVIAVHQLRRVAVDDALIWLIALPLLTIFVLGITLQGMFAANFVPDEPFRITVASSESTAVTEIIGALETMPEYLVVERSANDEDARRSVLTREADAAVIVPAAFPEQRLTVVAAPGSIAGDIVADVLEGRFGETDNAAHNNGRAGDQASEQAGVPSGAGAEAMPWFQVSAFEYYSIGITIMFTMFAAHSAMIYSASDRLSGAYARTRALGVTRAAYLAAGFVSAVLIGVVFIAVMTGITRVLFGVAWGPFIGWLALTITGAAGVAAISFLLMTVLPPNPKGVENGGSVVYMLLSYLGGSAIPLAAFPEWFTSSLSWLPNRALLDGYLALATGGGLGDLSHYLLINIVTAVAFFALAWSVAGVRMKGEA